MHENLYGSKNSFTALETSLILFGLFHSFFQSDLLTRQFLACVPLNGVWCFWLTQWCCACMDNFQITWLCKMGKEWFQDHLTHLRWVCADDCWNGQNRFKRLGRKERGYGIYFQSFCLEEDPFLQHSVRCLLVNSPTNPPKEQPQLQPCTINCTGRDPSVFQTTNTVNYVKQGNNLNSKSISARNFYISDLFTWQNNSFSKTNSIFLWYFYTFLIIDLFAGELSILFHSNRFWINIFELIYFLCRGQIQLYYFLSKEFHNHIIIEFIILCLPYCMYMK